MKKLKKLLSCNKGLTLIDLSILIIAVGLIISTSVSDHEQKTNARVIGSTIQNSTNTTLALSNFYSLNQRYPCPAVPTLDEDDVEFGKEDCTLSNNIIATGTIPYRTLGIEKEQILDGHKRRFIYSVSAIKSDNRTGANRARDLNEDGTIDEDEIEASVTAAGVLFATERKETVSGNEASQFDDVINNLNYVLFSAGLNGYGAYNQDGGLFIACPDSNDPDNPIESENCDGDAEFISHHFRVSSGRGDDSVTYDDYMEYDQTNGIGVLFRADKDGNTKTHMPKIGIGIDNPEFAIDVYGNIEIDAGNVNIEKYCVNESGTTVECLEVAKLTVTGMNCDNANQIGISIGGNNVQCTEGVLGGLLSKYKKGNRKGKDDDDDKKDKKHKKDKKDKKDKEPNPTSCPDDEFVKGVSKKGVLICEEITYD